MLLALLAYNFRNGLLLNKELFRQPANFPAVVYDTLQNRLSAEGISLGKKLFYDPLLSRNNTISCASCHHPDKAFSDAGRALSYGIDGKAGSRNAPSLVNLAWSKQFFWDGSVSVLDLQPIVPITNHVEMDETIDHLLQKLRTHPHYPALFQQVFGKGPVSVSQLTKALSQFLLQCTSADSKYDQVVRHEGAAFSNDEQAGYRLFQQHCARCHAEPLFTNDTFADNGIGGSVYKDEGRFVVTHQLPDKYRFKVPTLRNVAFTGPYMHDGRFTSLTQVLDHYAAGIQQTANLDTALRKGIRMSMSERKQVVAFLQTLSDTVFVRNGKLRE